MRGEHDGCEAEGVLGGSLAGPIDAADDGLDLVQAARAGGDGPGTGLVGVKPLPDFDSPEWLRSEVSRYRQLAADACAASGGLVVRVEWNLGESIILSCPAVPTEERLGKEIADVLGQLRAAAEVRALAEQVGRLRAALAPLAAVGDVLAALGGLESPPDGLTLDLLRHVPGLLGPLTAGDCRRAREVLGDG